MTSRTVDARTGAQVFFKCENFQRMGAFKFRGAFNALAQLRRAGSAARRARLLLGQPRAGGGAGRARLLGVRATIVMPQDAPQVKLEATRGYGAEVVPYDRHATVARRTVGDASPPSAA